MSIIKLVQFLARSKAWATDKFFVCLIIISLVSLLLTSFGLLFDHRLVNGELIWIKPMKFSVSFALFAVSMIWLRTFITTENKLLNWSSAFAVLGAVTELSLIGLQAFRGTASHFNTDTPFDECLWLALKVAIVPVALSACYMFAILLREKNLPVALGLSIRWALILTIVGFIPGLLMVVPDHIQALITKHYFDGHTIGLPDGGPGIPVIGWSTIAGDLRVPHFIGLHALQVMPIVGWSISKIQMVDVKKQITLINQSGFIYLCLICYLTVQALNGQSAFDHTGEISTLRFVSAIAIFAILNTAVPRVHRYLSLMLSRKSKLQNQRL